MIEYSREKDEYSWDCDNRNCKGKVFGTPDERLFNTSDSTFGHTTLGDLKSIIDEAIEKYGSDTEVKFDEHECKGYNSNTSYDVNVNIIKKKYESNDEYYKHIVKSLDEYKEKVRKEKQLKKDIAELSLMLNTDTLFTSNIENSDLYTLEKILTKLRNEE